MTREEQRKLRELNKALPKILREKIKAYPFKKKDFMIWYSNKELFFDLLITVNVTEEGHCVCSSRETVKPLWLDELLWDFLKMKENKKEPLSLRAVGAFTVTGSEIFARGQELKDWDICELEKCVDGCLEHFYHSVQTAAVDDFIRNMKSKRYHSELREALTYVHDQKYSEALNCLKDLGDGAFRNGEISINSAIREFCEEKLKGKVRL